MSTKQYTRLHQSDGNPAFNIPIELDLPYGDALMPRRGDTLVVEPLRKTGLLEWLALIEPLEQSTFRYQQKNLALEKIVD